MLGIKSNEVDAVVLVEVVIKIIEVLLQGVGSTIMGSSKGGIPRAGSGL